jgi:hypothetical protein
MFAGEGNNGGQENKHAKRTPKNLKGGINSNEEKNCNAYGCGYGVLVGYGYDDK